MWSFIKAARLALARMTARPVAVAAIGLFAATTAASSQPVEYVKVCSLYGAGYFYIPGTDTCTYAPQTVENQFGLARLNTLSATGTAMAAALVAPYLPTGTNFAVSPHWAAFDGQHAIGFSGLMRLSGNFVLSGGFSLGLDRGSLTSLSNRTQTQYGTAVPEQSWSEIRGLGRAGFMYAW